MNKCERCGQPISRLERPWTTSPVGGESFGSDWVNPFGFPWCPGDGEPESHSPSGGASTSEQV